jgi:preprotein translocase subunit SecE
VAKSKAAKRTKSQNAIIRYLRDTRAELRKVRWPTRQEAWGLTRIVLAVTVALALFMWLLDYLFSLMLSGLVNQNIVAIIVASVVLAGSIATFVILNLQRAQ